MTTEYILRTALIVLVLLSSCYCAVRIRTLIQWVKSEDLFDNPNPGMRQIPCQVLSEIRRYATFILISVGLVCILEYGWIVYRYTTPPTPTEYFAYTLNVEPRK